MKWNTLSAPYHWDVMGYIMPSADTFFTSGRIISPAESSGHPPLFFIALASVWKLFGRSLLVSHLFNLILGGMGLTFLFVFTSKLYGMREAAAATLLLFFNQLFFAQVGILYLSVALMSMAVLTVYAYLNQKYILFLVSASALVLVQETSVVVLVSILLFDVFQNVIKREKFVVILKKLLRFSLPFVPLFGWFIFHWIKTGWVVNTNLIVNKGKFLSVFISNLSRYLIYDVSAENVNKANWLVFLLVFIFLIISVLKHENIKKEILLLLVIVLNIAFFSYSDDLPRYFLIIFPFYFVLGARAFVYVSSRVKFKHVCLSILLVLMIINSVMNYSGQRNTDGWRLESNMEYLDLVRLHKTVCAFLEDNYPTSKIITTFPLTNALQIPWYGYVDQPLEVVPLSTFEDQKDVLVVRAMQSNYLNFNRFMQANKNKLKKLQEFFLKGKSVIIYKSRNLVGSL